MSHVLIQNEGELPIWGLRLLGLSEKTSDQIGQFGTGLKESIALLSRMDVCPVIFSGTMRIEFSTQQLGGKSELCFKLSEDRDQFCADKWHGLGMHPNFGHRDWTDPWMVFREILCNALDESGTDGLYHDVISQELEGVAGSTRVYIPCTPDILTAYAGVHEKLLALSDYEIEMSVSGVGRALKKRKRSSLQIFYRGVWVQEDKMDSMFDYEFDGLELNESRSADWYYVNSKMSRVISQFTVRQVKTLLKRMLIDSDTKFYEADVLHTAAQHATVRESEPFVEAFFDMYGDKAVVTDNDKFYYDRLDSRGHKPVVVTHNGLLELLKAAGVPGPIDVLSREERLYSNLIEAPQGMKDMFNGVWAMFAKHQLTEGKEKPGLMAFIPRNDTTETVYGEYRGGICYINAEHSGSPWETYACIEEIAHHISGAHDYSAEFQMFLLKIAASFGGWSITKVPQG